MNNLQPGHIKTIWMLLAGRRPYLTSTYKLSASCDLRGYVDPPAGPGWIFCWPG